MSDTEKEAETPAADEIEVTDEMIRAGVDAFMEFEITEGDEDDWAKGIVAAFKAMIRMNSWQKGHDRLS